MSVLTYNGWPVVPSSECRSWQIPGSRSKIRLLDRPAGFVLAVFLSWFNDTIEKLDGAVLDDWGWAPPRPARGLTIGTSNHCSGTAADVNALEHVQGRRGTFTARQKLRVLAALRLYYRVLGWGGVWRRVDEMHFEIRPGTTHYAATMAAFRLAKTPRGQRVLGSNPGAREMLRRYAS